MHGGPAVRLGEDEELVLAGLGAGVGRQPLEGRADRVALVARVMRIGAENAEPGAGNGGERVVLPQLVLPVPEEGEVVVREPAQQLTGLLHLLVAQVVGGRLGGQLVGDAQRGVAHLLPVLHGLTGVGQDAQQVGGDLLQIGAVRLAVDLDVDPGLDERVVGQLADGPGLQDLDELAGEIAPHDDLRVDDDVDPAPLPGQLVGDGVDEEGHVVRDHLDDGVAAGPAVLLDRRGVDSYVGRALRSVLGQPVVREGGSEDVVRVAVGEVFRGGVQVVALEEREQGVLVGSARARLPGRQVKNPPDRAVLSYPGGPFEQLGLGFVQLGLHCPLAPVARRCVTS